MSEQNIVSSEMTDAQISEVYGRAFKVGVEFKTVSVRCTCGSEVECKALFHYRFGAYGVVGHGEVTNPDPNDKKHCGKRYGFYVCLNEDLHGAVRFDNSSGGCSSYKGKGYMKVAVRRCHDSHCPECYKAWACREASAISERFKATKGVFGKEEHIIHSPDVREVDWSTDLVGKVERFRKQSVKYMKELKVIGGVQILHCFRYASKREALEKGVNWGWYWSLHFHYIGYVEDGYGHCRHCDNRCGEGVVDRERCLKCGGFEGRNRKLYDNGAGIFKVKGERVSIGATAYYQLNHSSTRYDVKHYNIVKWFGVVSCRKFHFVREPYKAVCPICSCELVRGKFIGKAGSEPLGYFDKDVLELFDDLYDADGSPRWMRCDGKSPLYPYSYSRDDGGSG